MKKTILLLLLCFFIHRLPSNAIGTIEQVNNRQYILFNPKNPRSAPLVIALHGGGGNPLQMEKVGFNRLAMQNNFVVVYPKGVDKHWNDGRKDFATASTANDVEFISNIIDKLIRDGIANPQKIFVTGISNGGIMTYRIGCELSNKVRAIAAVSANMSVDLKCRPSKSLPILIINGTADKLMPWNGGEVESQGEGRGEVISTKNTVGFWTRINNCREYQDTVRLPDKYPGDETNVIIHNWNKCSQPVVLYEVRGGGHGWPGQNFRFRENGLLDKLIGPVTQEIHAEEEIWRFFERID
jgi:polyhydroxybutyrate depolymerase